MTLLDFTPLLFCLSTVFALSLARAESTGALCRVCPAAILALLMHGAGYAPRVQVAVFFVMYLLDALAYALLRLWQGLSAKK